MGRIILVGWLCINIPITAIILLAGFFASFLGYNFRMGVLLGGIVGWTYWSFTIPLWRKWALKESKDEEKLEKYGRLFLLTFKKDSLFTKTEYKYKNK